MSKGRHQKVIVQLLDTMAPSKPQIVSLLVFAAAFISLYFLYYQSVYDGVSKMRGNFHTDLRGITGHLLQHVGSNDTLVHEERIRNLNAAKENFHTDFRGINDHLPKHIDSNYTLVHEERIRNLKAVCEEKELFSKRTYRGGQSLTYYYSEKYDFAYCKVPKSGCTFWTQVFLILNDYSVEQTFSMKRMAVHGFGGRFSISSAKLRMKNPRMVLVSRDPYSRLYSGYIDKIYLGLFSVYRTKILTEETECNFYITFEQFLQHIIESARANLTINRHWAPIFSLCKPCDVNQYRLVKQETFAKDVELVLKEIGLGTTKYTAITDALHDHRAEATIPGIIETTYLINRRKQDVLDCIGLAGVARRLWESFQIQGFIHNDADFPDDAFTNEDEYDNHTKLTELILETANNYPLTSEERKQQRYQALVTAYKSVSKESIEGIKEIYRPDFRLFNYDENPPT